MFSSPRENNSDNENICHSKGLAKLQGVPKNLLEPREQYIVVSRFSSVFSECLTRGVINAARTVTRASPLSQDLAISVISSNYFSRVYMRGGPARLGEISPSTDRDLGYPGWFFPLNATDK